MLSGESNISYSLLKEDMPSPKPNETPEQRAARLKRQSEYRARVKARDPEAFAKKARAAAAKYRLANLEKAKSAAKRWREANRDQFNATRKKWRARNQVRALFLEARSRAKTRGVDFTIELEDIPPMGELCPLLGLPFPSGEERNGVTSPSLDRIDPSKGYVPGNVWIVGRRANMVKNDGTAEEHEKIAAAMRKWKTDHGLS